MIKTYNTTTTIPLFKIPNSLPSPPLLFETPNLLPSNTFLPSLTNKRRIRAIAVESKCFYDISGMHE
jgi:hypothetical protein